MERPPRVARVNIISVGGGEEYVDILGVLVHGRDCASPGGAQRQQCSSIPKPPAPSCSLGGIPVPRLPAQSDRIERTLALVSEKPDLKNPSLPF